MGLQGAGKTTTAGKLAYRYKGQGRRVLLVAADTQRPAAREQLKVLGDQIGVPVFEVHDGERPAAIAARLKTHLQKDFRDWSSSTQLAASRSTSRSWPNSQTLASA